jgi:hypothetical protein
MPEDKSTVDKECFQKRYQESELTKEKKAIRLVREDAK